MVVAEQCKFYLKPSVVAQYLERLRQKDCEFEVNLGYSVRQIFLLLLFVLILLVLILFFVIEFLCVTALASWNSF